MPKLNQINALVTANKSNAEKSVTESYKILQKESLFRGFERTYKPLDENDPERLPAERQRVQYKVADLISQARDKWSEVWDLIYTQDAGNQTAMADLVVGDVTVAKNVPVTTLLYLDKQINDVETFINHIPTPDLAEEWTRDANAGLLRTKESTTVRTKKVEEYKVIVQATKEHPAQTAKTVEDRISGHWNRISYSGEMSTDAKTKLQERVKQLKDSIKVAREQANMVQVEKMTIGSAVFGFLFG